MNFEKPELNKTSQKDPVKDLVKDPIIKKLENFFVGVFNNNLDPGERLSEMLNRLKIFLDEGNLNILNEDAIKKIKNDLADCSLINNQEEFINKGIESLSSLVNWSQADPRAFEAKLRENVVAVNGYKSLNEMLTYGEEDDHIHLHVNPSETLRLSEKLYLIKDGLRKLKEILRSKENIKEVIAVSWIVANNPGIMEKLGFTVEGPITPEDKERHLNNDNRDIYFAHISRDDILNPEKNLWL